MDIYTFLDYRKFLEKYIHSLPGKGHGFRSKMAQQLNVKTSFISMMFAGKIDFSIEQAFALRTLFTWSDMEAKYFMNLVHKERAGTKELKAYYQAEIEKIRTEALRVKNQIVSGKITSKDDEQKYFSNADYALVHILTTIPEFQNKEALLKKMKISPNRLEKILSSLIEMGLIQYEKSSYTPGPARLHLSDDASIIISHHTNWRIQAIKACQYASEDDLHYSSVISLSQADFFRIKTLLLKELAEWKKVIKDSPCEKPFSLCLDFYEIK